MTAFWSQLACDYSQPLADRGLGQLDSWVEWGKLEAGDSLAKGEPLFPRYQVRKENA